LRLFNGPLSTMTQVSWYQKKTFTDWWHPVFVAVIQLSPCSTFLRPNWISEISSLIKQL